MKHTIFYLLAGMLIGALLCRLWQKKHPAVPRFVRLHAEREAQIERDLDAEGRLS